jgi:hypothetical protein
MSALADKLEEADHLNEISDLHAKVFALRNQLREARSLLQAVVDGRLVGGSFEKKILLLLARSAS